MEIGNDDGNTNTQSRDKIQRFLKRRKHFDGNCMSERVYNL